MEYLSSNLPNNKVLYPGYKPKRKYRFHIPGFIHLPCSARYYPCAFTNKLIKFSKMMLSLGHEVYIYAAETSDVPCTELIVTHTVADIAEAWGDGDKNFELGYDWTKEFNFRFEPKDNPKAVKLIEKFMVKTTFEISKRLKPDDFVVFAMGTFHQPIAEQLKGHILKVENGVAYRNTFCKFRAFESEFMKNYVMGLQGVGKDTPDGKFYDRVIPNFFEAEHFPASLADTKPDNYILFVGRLIPRKGLNIAVRLAEATKTRLLMAGQGTLTGVSPYIELLGVLDPVKRAYYMSHAKAVIVPTIYVEPFGGVGVEAMLSGAPILTTNFGVFPEYNVNGVTGFRCDLFRDFVTALKKVDSLDRHVIRRHAERYLMDNIKWEYQKWFDEIYDFYLAVTSGSKKKQQNVWFEL